MSEDIPPSLFKILREDIAGVNTRFDTFATSMVSQTFIAQMQANQKERDDRQDARLKELEDDLAEERRTRVSAQDDARKTKAQQWFAIGTAILGSVLAIIGGVVIWTVTQGIQQAVPGIGG